MSALKSMGHAAACIVISLLAACTNTVTNNNNANPTNPTTTPGATPKPGTTKPTVTRPPPVPESALGNAGTNTSSNGFLQNAFLTINNRPARNVRYSTHVDQRRASNRAIAQFNGVTSSNGQFRFDPAGLVAFRLGNTLLGTMSGAALKQGSKLNLETIIDRNTSATTKPVIRKLPTLMAITQGAKPRYYTLPANINTLTPLANRILTFNGWPVSGVKYQSGNVSGVTDGNGLLRQQGRQPIILRIADLEIGSAGSLPTTLEAVVRNTRSRHPVVRNLNELLLELNGSENRRPRAGFHLHHLEQQLLKPAKLPTGRLLGINMETPQAEADSINQPLITADIFRVARPFAETSCAQIRYNALGWPRDIPSACNTTKQKNGHSKYAFTRILQYAPTGSFPEGSYEVFYDGTGTVEYGGMGCNKKRIAQGHDVIAVAARHRCASPGMRFTHNSNNFRGLEVSITKTDPRDPVRNIRVVMPGGTCRGNPFQRVPSAQSCRGGGFVSFAELLKHNRNAIVFNPDYLNFAKDFRVLRMMNLMEASPRRPESQALNPCPDTTPPVYEECLLQPLEWKQRPTLQQASWGGSFRTGVRKRQGVPLEVAIALANQLKAHPWFNIPYNADDNFVRQYAKLVRGRLQSPLIAHVEYSNELWNAGFWGHNYATVMGRKDRIISKLHDFPGRNNSYSARTRFTAKRAKEIFVTFAQEMRDGKRLKRILGGQHKFPRLAHDIITYADTKKYVDAFAIAPYFHGCWSRQASRCKDRQTVPITLTEVRNIDQLFAVMASTYNTASRSVSGRGDTDSMDATIKLIAPQMSVARKHGVELYAYEGGQHLTVNWSSQDATLGGTKALRDQNKARLGQLMFQANRDRRMGEHYTSLLNGWKEAGAGLFVLFTAPQTFNRFGTFGMKEQINTPLSRAPKLDAALRFQQELKGCWPGYFCP